MALSRKSGTGGYHGVFIRRRGHFPMGGQRKTEEEGAL